MFGGEGRGPKLSSKVGGAVRDSVNADTDETFLFSRVIKIIEFSKVYIQKTRAGVSAATFFFPLNK